MFHPLRTLGAALTSFFSPSEKRTISLTALRTALEGDHKTTGPLRRGIIVSTAPAEHRDQRLRAALDMGSRINIKQREAWAANHDSTVNLKYTTPFSSAPQEQVFTSPTSAFRFQNSASTQSHARLLRQCTLGEPDYPDTFQLSITSTNHATSPLGEGTLTIPVLLLQGHYTPRGVTMDFMYLADTRLPLTPARVQSALALTSQLMNAAAHEKPFDVIEQLPAFFPPKDKRASIRHAFLSHMRAEAITNFNPFLRDIMKEYNIPPPP